MKRRDRKLKELADKVVICKFQRPLFDSRGSMNNILVYNETHDVDFTQEMTDEQIKSIFPNGEYKTYWACLPSEKNPHTLNPIALVEGESLDW